MFLPTWGLTAEDISFVGGLLANAGSIALQMRSGVKYCEKAPGDFVTEADRTVSKLIVERLSKRFPADLIVSEEGDGQPGSSRRAWLVDPIDGTKQYLENSNQFCVMVGLLLAGTPTFGWIYKPTDQTLFFGGPDYGTFKQSGQDPESQQPMRRHRTLSTHGTKRLIITRGDMRSRPWLQQVSDLTTFFVGSMGVRITWLIEDKADMAAHLKGWLKVWDTAAPVAVALGAGLEVGSGRDFSPGMPYPDVLESATYQQEFPSVFGKSGTLEWARQQLVERT